MINKSQNIYDVVSSYELHITRLQIAYGTLIEAFNDSINNVEPLYYENFEKTYKEAFLEYCITSLDFIAYLERYILDTDIAELPKVYNLISNKIKKLLWHKRLEYNPKYPFQNNSLFKEVNPDFYMFAHNVGFETDEDGDYKKPLNDFFTADNLYDKIVNELNWTQKQVDIIFSTKELNQSINTATQPTTPQKQIEPIKWLKNSNLLAYLINELKTYGFIDEDNIWAICEQLFVDKKGKPIKAQTFTSMVKNYENNQTPDGTKGKPKTHTEITELIKTIKALSKEIE
jgi:hypothetical protein